jgi:hypothetical protein
MYVFYKINLNTAFIPLVTEPIVTQLDLLPLLDLEKKLSKE